MEITFTVSSDRTAQKRCSSSFIFVLFSSAHIYKFRNQNRCKNDTKSLGNTLF